MQSDDDDIARGCPGEEVENFLEDQKGDDVVVYSGGVDELFEDELGDETAAAVETVQIRASQVVGFLPDLSVATGTDATDSTCSVDCIRISSDHVLIAVGSCDERCRIYRFDLLTRSLILLQTLSEFHDSVVSVQFSYDGEYLAAACYDSTVRVYQIDKSDSEQRSVATLVQTLEGPFLDLEFVRWHPNGYALIAGSKDLTAWMWWAPTGRTMTVFSGHGGPVSCGAFAHAGKSIVTGEGLHVTRT